MRNSNRRAHGSSERAETPLEIAREIRRKLQPRGEVAKILPIHTLAPVDGKERCGVKNRTCLHVFDIPQHLCQRFRVLESLLEPGALIFTRMQALQCRIQPLACFRLARAVRLGRRRHRIDHTFGLSRLELLQVQVERNEQLLAIAQPVEEYLPAEDLHDRFVVSRRNAGVRGVRRVGMSGLYDVALRVASAASIWLRSCEKSIGFAW